MSRLTIQLIILTTLVVGWTIFMLYQRHQHKKRMRQIDKEWEERRRRWAEQVPFDSEVPTEWVIQREEISGNLDCVVRWGGEWVPIDEVRSKTDKLSPTKKMGKHMMR
tara:strand:+ start:26 stop:349 length:324 start_codon:yes stop_codon:yes gene_type:complete